MRCLACVQMLCRSMCSLACVCALCVCVCCPEWTALKNEPTNEELNKLVAEKEKSVAAQKGNTALDSDRHVLAA